MRHAFRALYLCLSFGPLLGVSGPAAAQDPSDIVDRVIEAYGGEAALAKSRLMVQEGRFLPAGGGEAGAVARISQWPGRLRMEIAHHGRPPETRILDGGRGWRDGVEAPPPLVGAMILQAARISLPAALADHRRDLLDKGARRAEDGGMIRTVDVPLGPGLTLSADIDEASGMIVASRGVLAMHGMEMVFAAAYRDHREWDGVVVAAREEQFAMGQHIGQTIIEKVTFPESVPDTLFRP